MSNAVEIRGIEMQLADLAFREACPSNRFLEEMEKVIPWSLFEQEMSVFIVHKVGGRRPYPRILLFRMHLLQTWFGLSDAQTSFQCEDRLSFRKFLGLGIGEPIPESTTLENFRHELEETGLDVRFLEKLDAFFKEKGLLLKEGNIVDATFIEANSRPRKDPNNQSDIDADHGHKGFGYSATVNCDRKSRLIRKVVTTSERPHDSQNLETSLVGDEKEIFADSGYTGQEEMLEKRKIKIKIIKKRPRCKKGEPTPELPLRDQYRNKLIAKLRAPGEHVFACWKTAFKFVRTAYRGLERVNQQVQSNALAYNLRRYGFLSRA
jgi:transposase, IS5 family